MKLTFLNMPYDFSEHFCLLIVPQDQWKKRDKEKISQRTFVEYISASKHTECHICMTCLICRGLWDLFDPENPGEYTPLCTACKKLLKVFKRLRGKGEAVLLFAHTDLEAEELKKFTDYILELDKVKKFYMLQLKYFRVHPRNFEIGLKLENASIHPKDFVKIEHKKLKKSNFIDLLNENKIDYKVLYEVSKDKYY
ncbi:MAG: hypothetical protein HWN65_20345 [Candidatus Helarchaeota archaeon]|nr:hypothetical protein [Candidatus Helarchaeota archaeon]